MCAHPRRMAVSETTPCVEPGYLEIPAYLRCRPVTVHAVLSGRKDRCAVAGCDGFALPGAVFCRAHTPEEPSADVCWFEAAWFERLLYTTIGVLAAAVLAAQYALTRGW